MAPCTRGLASGRSLQAGSVATPRTVINHRVVTCGSSRGRDAHPASRIGPSVEPPFGKVHRNITGVNAHETDAASKQLHKTKAVATLAPPSPVITTHDGWQHKNPFQALQSEASHTAINMCLGSVDLYGNYQVRGPAIIRKVNDALVAWVEPGGEVSVLNGQGPCSVSSADMGEDSDMATCNLMGTHLQLEGAYWMTQNTGTQHGDSLIINVNRMSEDSFIMLLPGGSISHPVNVCPTSRGSGQR